MIFLDKPEGSRKLQDRGIAFLEKLREKGAIQSSFNTAFFFSGDSREPEQAGILGALIGSAYTMLVTLLLCLPIGVGAAVYLEEFAPKGRLTDIVEVNINNLASVPSIVFGLLGLAVFLNFFGLPRSSPLVRAPRQTPRTTAISAAPLHPVRHSLAWPEMAARASNSGRADYARLVDRLRADYAAIPTGEPVRLAKRTSNLFRTRAAGRPAGARRHRLRRRALASTPRRAQPTSSA